MPDGGSSAAAVRPGDRLPAGARALVLLALLGLVACGDGDDGAVEPTRTPTPTATPAASATPRPTSVPTTPVIATNWLAGLVEVDTLEVGLEGRPFLDNVYLRDAAGRFCTSRGALVVRVDVDGDLTRALTVGPGRVLRWRAPIYAIPAGPTGTYDLVVSCGASTPEAFRITGALRYQPGYVATATPTMHVPPAAVPTAPPAP